MTKSIEAVSAVCGIALFVCGGSQAYAGAHPSQHTPKLAITSSTLPGAQAGQSYVGTLAAQGGTLAYVWSVSSGQLPSGLHLAAATGVISGTPLAGGTFSFTANVADSGSPVQSKAAGTSIAVAASAAASLVVTSSTLSTGQAGVAYAASLSASGGTPGYTWSISSGQLPSGLTMSAATGAISGTPTASGNFSFTASVKDSGNPVQAQSTATSIAVAAASATTLAISSSTLPTGQAGVAYAGGLTASGGTLAYTWSISSGQLPAGLTLAATTGAISGTPNVSGAFNFSASVKDSGNPVQSQTAATSISVTPAAATTLAITSSALSAGQAGTAYAAGLTAVGGTLAYTWSISSGQLPSGLTLAATTGVISGTPNVSGTFNFSASVKDSGSPVQSQTAATAITVATAPVITGAGTTWYVRPDGGSRYSARTTSGQCDGQADAAYTGVGTNQHCAFNDYRYLWDDRSYGNSSWVIAGGDTVLLRGGPWRVGFDQGTSPNDVWCSGGNGPFACVNPTIPAGTAAQPTRILGENYAGCSATNKTQIFGGYGVWMALNLGGAQNVKVECLEITRHSQCVVHGSPVYPSGCSSSYPIDDYDSTGISTDTGTRDVLLQDLWIHGHTDRGIKGPIGGVITANRVDIAFNGMAGWDFDDGNSTASINGVWNFQNSIIEWNGCNQEYPAVHAIPVISCYSQSTGGYGDGVGTPANYGMSAHIDHSTFRFNTQDGLDLGHIDTGNNTLTITSSIAYGNSGQPFKWGPNMISAVFENNLALGNCMAMSQPMPGAPSTYNANLTDFCRANDTLSFNFRNGGTALLANNTIVTYAPTTLDINCWDASTTGCPTALLTFKNNIVRGYDNPLTYNMGGQSGGPGFFYYAAPVPTVRSNNLIYGIRGVCPNTSPNEFCADPQLVGAPVSYISEADFLNFNFRIGASSPARGAGISVSGLLTDFAGSTRPDPPAIGGYE